MMKVLALSSKFRLCGQGIAAHYLAEGLARRKCHVRLRVFDTVQELKGQFKGASYKVDFRPSVPLMPSTGLHVFRQAMDLLRLRKEEEFDIVLALDGGEAGVLGAAFAKEAGLPVAIVCWGNDVLDLGTAERGVLRNADLVLPVSRWAKANLIELGFDEENMKVLPPGVDHDIFAPAKARPRELGIVTVTDLRDGCGVDVLIDVLKNLLDKGHDAFLSVVGAGPGLRALRRRAKDALLEGSVRFLGRVPHSEMPEVLRGHKVFALVPRTVRDHPQPDVSLAMMEAASCGLGVVGTELGGIADTLRSCGGTKVPSEGLAKIADAVERVAGKPTIVAATEGKYGRVGSWAEVAKELEGILDGLVYE